MNDEMCSCFPGLCRGGQVIGGKTPGGLTCKNHLQVPVAAPVQFGKVAVQPAVTVQTSTLQAALDTLNRLGYTYNGGELWEPPLGPKPAFSAPDLLDAASGHMRDRAKTYDKPEGERSMGATVEAFNAITGRDLRESEGWLLMSILKMVRSETRDAPHRDSIEDLVAYSGLYGEARLGGV